MRNRAIPSVLLAALALPGWVSGARAEPCQPPAGFVDDAHPEVAPIVELVSHVEDVSIDRPLDEVLAFVRSSSLEDAIDPESPLPTVTGTHVLTEGKFWGPGSRRIVCLSDQSTLVEQVLIRDTRDDSHRFRYVVWNYSTESARPIHYGVGEFVYTKIEEERTHVKWTYSFELKDDTFPGYLGGLGRWLFRVAFLDRQYADMMRGTLARTKARAEASVAAGP